MTLLGRLLSPEHPWHDGFARPGQPPVILWAWGYPDPTGLSGRHDHPEPGSVLDAPFATPGGSWRFEEGAMTF